MDIFLGKVTQQAMNYAIRSGIAITASYAIKQSSRLLRTVEGDERQELQDLQRRLSSKIQIISPAIDMIELIAARGNTSLESAVGLTKSLRREIHLLGQRLASAAASEEHAHSTPASPNDRTRQLENLKGISKEINRLLNRIEDAVPLINLAITASGASLSSSLAATISPSRLLQASTFVTAGDSFYGSADVPAAQIGPSFTLSMYMLFQGHIRNPSEDEIRESTWMEVMHKATVKVLRVPLDALGQLKDFGDDPTLLKSYSLRPDEYAYQLVIVEDLDDDRVHTFDDNQQPGPFGGILQAGIREIVPIHQLSKIFYADTGKILNIGGDNETNNPVLLLRRDIHASVPRRWQDDGDDSPEDAHEDSLTSKQTPSLTSAPSKVQLDSQLTKNSDAVAHSQWRLPSNLDPEWIALEVYNEGYESESGDEDDYDDEAASATSRNGLSRLQNLTLEDSTSGQGSPKPESSASPLRHGLMSSLPPLQTSLSLLEMLLRLLSLQQFQQAPHLSIPDELLNFFLSESASTGAASNDTQERKRLRDQARRRVGFDPYDESPVKLRGEEYQKRSSTDFAEWDDSRQSIGPDSPAARSIISSRASPPAFNTQNQTPQSRRYPKVPPASGYPMSPSPPEVPHSLNRSLTNQAGKKIRDSDSVVASKRGSLLARPGSGVTDEGIGSSPGYEALKAGEKS